MSMFIIGAVTFLVGVLFGAGIYGAGAAAEKKHK